MPLHYLFFTLKQHKMKNGLFKLAAFDWIKGAIVSVLVAVLTYVQQLLTEGSQVSIKMILTTSITALIGYMIKQLMTDDSGSILSMVGGRKKRKKKPTEMPNNNVFIFEGNDFTLQSVVTYTSDMNIDESITVGALFNGDSVQSVQFLETIQFNDIESLYFEVEVD